MGMFGASGKRPKDVKVFTIWKTGLKQNCMEFKINDARAYYLERPDSNPRSWEYILTKGNQTFYVLEEGQIFRIHRDQAEANIQFFTGQNDLVFTLHWRGKGDAGGLTSAPRQHFFSYKGVEYEWIDSAHTSGTDCICRSLATKETVAYFRDCLLPTNRVGKLEIGSSVEERLEEWLVASFVAYREWTIRRQMLIYGDDYFNQSVTG